MVRFPTSYPNLVDWLLTNLFGYNHPYIKCPHMQKPATK
jgi:hypothetical protein